jgi:hypothetical protein
MGNLSCKPYLPKIQSYKINRDTDEILTVDLNKINKENTKDELILMAKKLNLNINTAKIIKSDIYQQIITKL